MFPCLMEKPAFSTRDAPIDKTNLFLLSGRTVSRCKYKNHGVQLSLYILKLSIFSCQLFCNSCSFSLFHFLQISLSITFTYFFSVRVKAIQNVIIKNGKNPWLETLLHLKKKHFSDLHFSFWKIALECKILTLNVPIPDKVKKLS